MVMLYSINPLHRKCPMLWSALHMHDVHKFTLPNLHIFKINRISYTKVVLLKWQQIQYVYSDKLLKYQAS